MQITPNQNLKRVGIIIPFFNVESYLKKCLDSVMQQTYSNLSIVLINNGSTDLSLQIAQEYVAKDSRFILIDQENKGVSCARNIGIDVFKQGLDSYGERTSKINYAPPPCENKIDYLFFLDSDDFLESNCIEIYVKNAQENHLEIVGSGINRYSYDYKYISCDFGLYQNLAKNQIFTGIEILDQIKCDFFYASTNLLIDFDFLIKHHLNFVENIIYEDHCFGISLFFKAKRIMILENHFYNHVSSLDSITRPKQITQERLVLNYQSWFKTIKQLEFLKLKSSEIQFQDASYPMISHTLILNRYLKNFYLPIAYQSAYALKDLKQALRQLKAFHYLSFKIVLLRFFPKLFFFFKKLKNKSL